MAHPAASGRCIVQFMAPTGSYWNTDPYWNIDPSTPIAEHQEEAPVTRRRKVSRLCYCRSGFCTPRFIAKTQSVHVFHHQGLIDMLGKYVAWVVRTSDLCSGEIALADPVLDP